MKAKFDNANLKIWFANQATSRNVQNVVEIEHNGDLMCITTRDGKTLLVNFSHVNLIEEL